MPTHRLRVQVPGVGQRPVENKPGLLVVGVDRLGKRAPLLLVWDDAVRNEGSGAAEAMETLLLWLQSRWPEFPVRNAVVVARATDAGFNCAHPEWNAEDLGMAPLVTWKPLRCSGTPSQSEDAFCGLFEAAARDALGAIRSIRGHPLG